MLSISLTMLGSLPLTVSDIGRYRKLAAERRTVNWCSRTRDRAATVTKGIWMGVPDSGLGRWFDFPIHVATDGIQASARDIPHFAHFTLSTFYCHPERSRGI